MNNHLKALLKLRHERFELESELYAYSMFRSQWCDKVGKAYKEYEIHFDYLSEKKSILDELESKSTQLIDILVQSDYKHNTIIEWSGILHNGFLSNQAIYCQDRFFSKTHCIIDTREFQVIPDLLEFSYYLEVIISFLNDHHVNSIHIQNIYNDILPATYCQQMGWPLTNSYPINRSHQELVHLLSSAQRKSFQNDNLTAKSIYESAFNSAYFFYFQCDLYNFDLLNFFITMAKIKFGQSWHLFDNPDQFIKSATFFSYA